jgi:hypothetical protein
MSTDDINIEEIALFAVLAARAVNK